MRFEFDSTYEVFHPQCASHRYFLAWLQVLLTSWITVNVLKDKPNEKAGLVNFNNEEDAKNAVSILHLYEVKGKQWTVEYVDQTTCCEEFVETEYVFGRPASSACLNTTE